MLPDNCSSAAAGSAAAVISGCRPSVRYVTDITARRRTRAGCRIATCMATPAPRLYPSRPARAADTAGVPVALELDGDDPPARGEQRRVVVHQAGRHQRPVDEYQGRPGALRLVVELEFAEPGEGRDRGRAHGAGVSFR